MGARIAQSANSGLRLVWALYTVCKKESLKLTSMQLAGSEGVKSGIEIFTAWKGEFLINPLINRGVNSKSGGEIHKIS